MVYWTTLLDEAISVSDAADDDMVEHLMRDRTEYVGMVLGVVDCVGSVGWGPSM